MKTVMTFMTLGTLVMMASASVQVERLMRPQRVTRGETAQRRLALLDNACWLTHPELKNEFAPTAMRVLRFKKAFTVKKGQETVELDVSADERFLLTCDGEFVGRGPHRGTVDNWMFQSYRLTLSEGEHLLEAVVWKHTFGNAPRAQLSLQLGFALAAAKPYDQALTTGIADWQVGLVKGVHENGYEGGPWGAGTQDLLVGSGVYDLQPAVWTKPHVARGFMHDAGWGSRQGGWQLYPTQLKDQTEKRTRPGKFVTGGALKFPRTFAPHTVTTNLWDLGEYRCAYPEMSVSGGKGAKIEWKWAESLFAKPGYKGDRRTWEGKTFDGFGDTFVCDGRDKAVFSSSWFRCGRWCRIIVETANEPLEIKDVSLIESRYPLECESAFVAPERPDLKAIQEICARGMQMCAHEMLFDCPYYEQQMYPGDTRLQLNIISSMTADDALIRRAIECYDLARFNDGLVAFNFPTWGHQEGLTYTLCYLLMHPDYLMNHANREWLKARLPGYRNTLSGVEYYARADGLLVNVPGWSFVDWPKGDGWKFGTPPNSLNGGPNGEINGFWLLALRGAAKVEAALGNPEMAAYWTRKAEQVAATMRKVFFDETRGLFADDPAHKYWSEHTQTLALIGEALTGDKAKACFEKLLADPNLVRTTVYFKYYLFQTYFKFGRADLFLKDLKLWQSYVDTGCTTCIEEPESDTRSSRSDCHAWGSHPLYFLRQGIAGIQSAAPYFEKVRVAPQPAGLKKIAASWPHPSGKLIAVDLAFEGGRAKGTVTTPVAGTFEWAGRTQPLKVGANAVEL